MRMGETEVKVLRGSDKVKVATDGDGNNECQLQQPTKPPDGTEESTQYLDTVHDTAHPPKDVQVDPGGHVKIVWNRCTMHGSMCPGNVREVRTTSNNAGNKGEHVKSHQNEAVEAAWASAHMHDQPTMAADKCDYCTSTDDEDTPK